MNFTEKSLKMTKKPEENIKKKDYNDKLNKIMKKQNDIISMSFSEYKIFIEEYAKKSKYPDIK